MKNVEKNLKNKIICASETEFRILSENSSAIAKENHTPERYIVFATQMNEIIGHKQKEPKLITGTFLL